LGLLQYDLIWKQGHAPGQFVTSFLAENSILGLVEFTGIHSIAIEPEGEAVSSSQRNSTANARGQLKG